MTACQPVEQQPLSQSVTYHGAFDVCTREVYHQMRACLIATHRQARCAQCAHQQLTPVEQLAPDPTQVPGQIPGRRERGQHLLTSRRWPHPDAKAIPSEVGSRRGGSRPVSCSLFPNRT